MYNEDIPMMMERETGLTDMYPAIGVGFGLVPMQSGAKSKAAGHPVFEERLFVKIVVPGDKQSMIFQPATEQHKQRFPRAYEAFLKRNVKPQVEGLLIEEWPQVSRSLAMTLRAANIFTVEALAEVSDAHITKIGSMGRELRAKAKAFLEVAKDTAASQAIAADAARKEAEIADLRRQISDLAKLVGGEKNRGGRPKGSKNKPKETITEVQDVTS